MIRMHRRISGAVTMLTLTALILTGCTSEASNIGRAKDKDGAPDAVDTGFTLSAVGSYDSADTAVVLSTDLDNKAVSLINMDTGKQYTLYYDGTTYVKDKYDGPMTISQIKAGDVVDVTFLKGRKKLASIKRSPKAWVYDDVYNYDLTGANRTASIGSQMYSLPDGAVVLSEGRRVEAGEVVSQDVVTISGIDHKIYSVNVDKGHGYLRLKNEQPLIGGWIEVGNSIIRQITEDMLLTVPEGTYQVVLTNNNVGCVKEVTVERNREVVLDVSDLEIAEDAVGRILFTVEPENAKVSVDGKPVDISKVVELKYGIHQIQAEANGYDTLTRHIQVGSEYATISFKLEESRKNSSADSVSGNSATSDRIPWQDTMDSVKANDLNKDSISDNTLSSISENALGTSNNYKVYVDSPRDVEVYLDGNYVGLSPVRFTKTLGRHEITLKKSGYKTKTYTIYLENTRKDETYSFSELEKEDSDGTKKNIPKEVTGAVSEVSDCKLTEGTDWIASEDYSRADLLEAGKEKIIAAVKNVVKEKIGETEAEKYTFTVEKDDLENVTPPGSEDGKGTAAVTIYRVGYETQTAGCNVALAKKGEEPSGPIITVEVEAEKSTVERGGTVSFGARVKIDGTLKTDTSVDWSVNGNKPISSDTKFKGGDEPSTLVVASDESATELTVTATYTDSDTGQTSSGQAAITVAEKAPEEVNVAFWIIPDEAEEKIQNVSVNGTSRGKDFPLKLPCGEHTITVEAEGYEKWEKTVTVSKDKWEISVELSAKDPGSEDTGDNPNEDGGEEDKKKSVEEDKGDSAKTDTQTNTNNAETEEENGGIEDEEPELTEETFTINKEAHPIKKWFSSLFKK